MNPTSEFQLGFLSKLQRLFSEGDFTATYKYALLIALADIAVERGSDDNSELRITHRELAVKFIELYWQQVVPYRTGDSQGGLIANNKGTQAAVVSAIFKFRQLHPGVTTHSAKAKDGYASLVRAVAATVSAQPVNYLQNLGGITDPFIYQRDTGAVTLKLGVTYSLRRFQPLVQQLARSHWIGHIKGNKLNHSILGSNDDLEQFLFHTPRKALQLIGEGLKRISNCRCFYCADKVQEADVDHFVPRALYPRDLAHNFVLAHPACNRSKSDTLAAMPHLERWLEYITKNDDDLQEIGLTAGRTVNLESTRAIAKWGYGNALLGQAQAWLKAGRYEPVDLRYTRALDLQH